MMSGLPLPSATPGLPPPSAAPGLLFASVDALSATCTSRRSAVGGGIDPDRRRKALAAVLAERQPGLHHHAEQQQQAAQLAPYSPLPRDHGNQPQAHCKPPPIRYFVKSSTVATRSYSSFCEDAIQSPIDRTSGPEMSALTVQRRCPG